MKIRLSGLTRVEAGSNTFTVTLRVVGGDEKDSKIWPRVLRDSDPKITAMARASCNCKGQTRPLVRQGVLNKKNRNCQTILKIWT
jgi:hypothetical protein